MTYLERVKQIHPDMADCDKVYIADCPGDYFAGAPHIDNEETCTSETCRGCWEGEVDEHAECQCVHCRADHGRTGILGAV